MNLELTYAEMADLRKILDARRHQLWLDMIGNGKKIRKEYKDRISELYEDFCVDGNPYGECGRITMMLKKIDMLEKDLQNELKLPANKRKKNNYFLFAEIEATDSELLAIRANIGKGVQSDIIAQYVLTKGEEIFHHHRFTSKLINEKEATK